ADEEISLPDFFFTVCNSFTVTIPINPRDSHRIPQLSRLSLSIYLTSNHDKTIRQVRRASVHCRTGSLEICQRLQ
ncbi:hypothetical protein, partial [Klebsiella oxytoca]|uniref:hypothetical protein n=1 Tax=Klebsiella oxytoca TaxID=571 RepID=UPI00387906A8